jgi:hypothetical protein
MDNSCNQSNVPKELKSIKVKNFRAAAIQAWRSGLNVIPIKKADKIPHIRGWEEFSTNQIPKEKYKEWVSSFPDAGVALCTGERSGIIAVDVDLPRIEKFEFVFEILDEILPETPCERFGSKGYHRYFRFDQDLSKKRIIKLSDEFRIEVLTNGCLSFLPPSIHYKTKEPFVWTQKSLFEVTKEDLPVLTKEVFETMNARITAAWRDQFSKLEVTKATKGRNDQLKSMVVAGLYQGKSNTKLVDEIVKYDLKFHERPLFNDATEGSIIDPFSRAEEFVSSIEKSVLPSVLESKIPEFLLVDDTYEAEKVDYIIEGFLGEGQCSIVAGAPKSGKSTFVRNVVTNLVKGEPFLGLECRPKKVLYCSVEESIGQYFEFLKRTGATATSRFYTLANPSSVELEKVIEQAVKDGFGLIVLDTLERLLKIPDINSYSMVNKAFERIHPLIKNSKIHLLMIHHTNKGERRGATSILGSSALRGITDINILFEGDGDSLRRITTEGRDVVKWRGKLLEFDEATKEYSLADEDMEENSVLVKRKIITLLKTSPGEQFSLEQIQKSTSSRRATVSECLTCLVREGKITKEGVGKKGSPATYYIPP